MSKNTVLLVVLVGIVVLLFVLSRTRLANNVKQTTTPVTTTAQTPALNRTIDINDVVNDPPVYSDLTLTLEGKINDWVTKNVFTITMAKSNFGNSGRTLPVITRDNFKLPEDTPESDLALGEVAIIRVTGKVVIFDRASLEQAWGVDLNDKEVDRWNKTPVLLVDKLEKLK